MAPTRKAKGVKRYATVNEASPEKYGGGSNKKKQRKRKLSDKLGLQWSNGELQRFYDAYRKYGKDWRKVAAAVRNRSIEMVEALYNMNRAYLSLPEGTASVVGLKAMMTDHYNVMEGSDSERESNDDLGFSRKPQKRKLGKDQPSVSKDVLHTHPSASLEGCLSLLKRRKLDGDQPRAVGKRTPRVPISYPHKKDDREAYVSPIKKGRKSEGDNDDDIAHVAALLTEASQRGGSPQVSQTPYGRPVHIKSSSVQSSGRMHPPPGKARANLHCASVDEDWLEGSLGSGGAETGDDAGDLLEGVGTVEMPLKVNKLYKKREKVKHSGNHQFDDGGEACSGTEGLNVSSRAIDDSEVSNIKGERPSPQGQRKESKKLYFGDESSCLDALQTLADLSVMMPDSKESGSSVQFKDEGANVDAEDKFSVPEATSTIQFRNKNKIPSAKHRVPYTISGVEGTNSKKSKLGRDPAVDMNTVSESEQQLLSTTKILKRKRKSSIPKISNADAHMDSDMNESSKTEGCGEEENKPVTKGKRTNQISTPSKQWKSARSLEGSLNSDHRRTVTDLTGSTAQAPTSSQVNLPTKRTSRRKMYIPRTLHPKEKSCEKKLKNQLITRSNSVPDRALHLKEKISCCLSSHLVHRWCTFEWFYSALDYPWFAKREFEEYLNHVGLGHIPRLTRVEWGVIRSSLGKPRRFSEHFLHEEREKLKQYRESVRKHYAELRTGVREGLPTDLARPLSVGQRVIALHPKTREVHDGSVLTVDHDKCRVQFDRPDIGVEFVMDVDCMPLNPLDNMPEALRRQNIAFDKSFLTSKESNKNGNLNFGGPMMFPSSGHLVKATSPVNASIKQGKGDAIHTTAQPKTASADIGRAQQTAYSQPGMVVPHNQAREADIRALSELNRALDKKEALLVELRNTNNNILENQNSGECSLKDSEPFKKHYATVLVQLKEASGQVSSALVNLRQRNTYPANSLPPWMKQPANSTIYGGPSSFDSSISQESGSSVADIVEVSKSKAHMMVNAAIQAMASRKCGEDAYVTIREALDSIDNQHFTSDSRLPVNRSQEQVNGSLGHRNQISSGTSDPNLTSDSSAPKLHDADKNEAQILSELISACVMAVHMIQTCTERQFPPAVVAQVLDYAVTSLHPRCPQNVGVYREIQMCMGRIKTQILALVPT
ncbi:protein ALWAYS EARLY 2-like isoform X1 [Malus sylvestris]|uniref:protein ALWAYS EARLY 2-like isoform X1 n=1 Tax=Malus sylvestris TaxID=3752 RepID=UPI0021ABC564|nr:protein ALWAYS EARLY 2-like isoform X1 [Malus sylvestris]